MKSKKVFTKKSLKAYVDKMYRVLDKVEDSKRKLELDLEEAYALLGNLSDLEQEEP